MERQAGMARGPTRRPADRAGARPDATATVVSLEQGLSARSDVNATQAHHPDTLLALEADGQVLSHDHGYPIR